MPSIASSFSLTCFLLLCVGLEMGTIVEELSGSDTCVSTEYQQLYDFHALLLARHVERRRAELRAHPVGICPVL